MMMTTTLASLTSATSVKSVGSLVATVVVSEAEEDITEICNWEL